MKKKMNETDLLNIKGSAAQILHDNIEQFNTCRTVQDVVDVSKKLFDENNLDTEWTRKFFYILNQKRSLSSALQYVTDCMFKTREDPRWRRRGMHENMMSEAMDDAQRKEFEKKLHEGAVKFKYTKKDGTERTANGTLKVDLMNLPPKVEDTTQKQVDTSVDKQKKKERKRAPDLVCYYDLDANGFRCFKMANFIDYI